MTFTPSLFSRKRLLHESIICLGYLTCLHEANQQNLCRCQPVLVLTKLCRLPVAYFSETDLANILLPTLISCCFPNPDNRALLVTELTPGLVANYIEVSRRRSFETIATNTTSVEVILSMIISRSLYRPAFLRINWPNRALCRHGPSTTRCTRALSGGFPPNAG